MTVILFLMIAVQAFAQQFQYRLEGSFQTSSAPGTSSPIVVNYIVNWNESSDVIQGMYQDNFFSQGSPVAIGGTKSAAGRNFLLIFPEAISGVKTISLKTPETSDITGSMPMKMATTNVVGAPVDSQNGFALMTTMPIVSSTGTTSDSGTCVVGFGALTKYCGLYNGTFNEIYDSDDRCHLLTEGSPRLELAPDTVFRLYLNHIKGIPNLPLHNIGAFLPSPQNSSINLSRQDCSALPGTSFESNNCRMLNLSGFFTDQGGSITFSGTYQIVDTTNGDSCSYSLNLLREVAY